MPSRSFVSKITITFVLQKVTINMVLTIDCLLFLGKCYPIIYIQMANKQVGLTAHQIAVQFDYWSDKSYKMNWSNY